MQSALEMVHDIRAEFDSILDEIDWMDPSTKAKGASINDICKMFGIFDPFPLVRICN